jgi:hypothetical protein
MGGQGATGPIAVGAGRVSPGESLSEAAVLSPWMRANGPGPRAECHQFRWRLGGPRRDNRLV